MRLPILPQRLEYEPDAELDGRLMPRQVGYVWLANMSMQSPRITVNSDGHRGRETDWSRPVLFAVGDSEWFGAGVDDQEVWTHHLEVELRRTMNLPALQVVNAGHPGFGPYHELVASRRVLAAHSVEAILVRVSIGQRYFKPVTLAKATRSLDSAERRSRIRRLTKFVPFLMTKLEAQIPSIQRALVPSAMRQGDQPAVALSATIGQTMLAEARPWWDALAALGDANDVPIIFVIHDIDGVPASVEIEKGLRQLVVSHRLASVVRLGPEHFGLDPRDPRLHELVHETLTLRRDPHANQKQHRLIAQAIFEFLRDSGIADQIREHASRRVPVTVAK